MTFPNMAEAFWDWDTAVKLKVVNKEIVDFEVDEEKVADIIFQGVVEPIPPQKLLVKPEGERKWKWYTLWTTQALDVDMIIENEACKQYRVMSASDWNAAGYYEYELAQGVPGE